MDMLIARCHREHLRSQMPLKETSPSHVQEDSQINQNSAGAGIRAVEPVSWSGIPMRSSTPRSPQSIRPNVSRIYRCSRSPHRIPGSTVSWPVSQQRSSAGDHSRTLPLFLS
uniref:Uncharacterized protein n=1 Tax=Arundo donax TaxID=35708 RepID=A0A0A9GEA0_ARUDO